MHALIHHLYGEEFYEVSKLSKKELDGIRWCIGNGKRIAVYKDKWLLKPDTFKPISPPTLHVDTIMGNLINTENQWDERKACKYHLLA